LAALTRIQIPGCEYALEFDTDKITGVELPRDVVDVPGQPGRREMPGPSRLILHFATLDDAPRWVEAEDASHDA
jgi:hypothetical protein